MEKKIELTDMRLIYLFLSPTFYIDQENKTQLGIQKSQKERTHL